MLAERIARRNMAEFLRAFERKDFTAMARFLSDDIVLEFQPGLPMSGRWEGIDEVERFFGAIFDYNTRFDLTLNRTTVRHPWSPRGNCTLITEWEAEEERTDGHRLRSAIISVADTHRWKTVRTRDYFFDVPAVAAHYGDIELPPRAPHTRAA